MDREEAVRLLRGGRNGIREWNERRERGEDIPDLRNVDLAGANLCNANLRNADLSHADLNHTNLSYTCFIDASLRHAELSLADLLRARLTRANLHGAKLLGTNLSDANLDGVSLTDATCHGAMLDGTHVTQANLSRASVTGATLIGVTLDNTTLSEAKFGFTAVCNCDLSSVRGLDEIKHAGPSSISVDTLLKFKDDLPETFLRGCGLRDEEIAYFRSQVGSAVRFYSCFISYSTADEEFATRLHNDFQAKGIRCWKWTHHARTGRNLWGEIDQAIRKYNKLVLIASKSSLKSPAVSREIERAIAQEDNRQKRKLAGETHVDPDVLFPVRLDDYIFDGWEHERKVDVTNKVIADARGWDKDTAIYNRVLNRLVRDLKPEP